MKVEYIEPCKRGKWGNFRGNIVFKVSRKDTRKMVYGQFPQRKIVPQLGLGFRLGLELALGLEAISFGVNCPRTKKNILYFVIYVNSRMTRTTFITVLVSLANFC